MMELYVLYHKSDPFPGYIMQAGEVDRSVPPDGSTMAEHVLYLKAKYGAELKYLPLGKVPNAESQKVIGNNLVPLTLTDTTPTAQIVADDSQEKSDAVNDYPDWGSVTTEITKAFPDPKQAAFILKLARHQFWRTRGKPI